MSTNQLKRSLLEAARSFFEDGDFLQAATLYKKAFETGLPTNQLPVAASIAISSAVPNDEITISGQRYRQVKVRCGHLEIDQPSHAELALPAQPVEPVPPVNESNKDNDGIKDEIKDEIKDDIKVDQALSVD